MAHLILAALVEGGTPGGHPLCNVELALLYEQLQPRRANALEATEAHTTRSQAAASNEGIAVRVSVVVVAGGRRECCSLDRRRAFRTFASEKQWMSVLSLTGCGFAPSLLRNSPAQQLTTTRPCRYAHTLPPPQPHSAAATNVTLSCRSDGGRGSLARRKGFDSLPGCTARGAAAAT